MNELLKKTADTLLRERACPGELLDCTHTFHRALYKWAGIPFREDSSCYGESWTKDSILDEGKALSPHDAGLCIVEYQRTAVFVRGVHQAISDLLNNCSERPLNILYAGTGPFAPLALCQLPFFSPDDVQFIFLDIHQRSLDALRKVIFYLGAERYVKEYNCDDAAKVRFAEQCGFHLIISEVMQRALEREPQVAVSENLSRFLADGGVFVPQRVDVSLAWLNPSNEHHGVGVSERYPDQFRLRLGKQVVMRLCGADAPDFKAEKELGLGTIILPEFSQGFEPYYLTEIVTYADHVLEEYDCSLTLPEAVKTTFSLKSGQSVSATYRKGDYPGIQLLPHTA